MRPVQHIFLAALPLVSLTSALAADLRNAVQEVPNDLLEDALQKTLSPKYRDGVFEHNENAIMAVHDENPELATRVVDLARQDLAEKLGLKKRQNSNTTSLDTSSSSSVASASPTSTTPTTTPIEVSSSTTPTTSTPPPPATSTSDDNATPPSSSDTGVLVPVGTTSTNDDGSVVEGTTDAFVSTAPTSAVVPITTTNAQGQAITTSGTVPAVPVTSTDATGGVHTTVSPVASVAVGSGGQLITSAPAAGTGGNLMTTTDQYGNMVVLSGATPGAVITTTDAKGRTIVTTITPGGGDVSALVLKTTTLPDGQLSTITSFANIGGATTTPSSSPGAKPSNTGSGTATLAQGMAAPTGRFLGEAAALVGGAIGFAVLL